MAEKAGAFGGRSVAGSNRDGWFLIGVTESLGGLGDADERGAEIALDVNGEGFDRGYIEDAAPGVFGRLVGGEHQAVDAPEERSESFSGAGGGEDQGGIAAGYGWPAEDLRARGTGEDGGEPVADGGVEEIEGVRGTCRWRRWLSEFGRDVLGCVGRLGRRFFCGAFWHGWVDVSLP